MPCLELFEPWMASFPSIGAFAYFWPVKSEASGRRNTYFELSADRSIFDF